MVSPSDFGVKPDGFHRPTVDDLISLCEQDQLATIHPDLDVSADSPVGQVNRVFMAHEANAWQALEDSYNASDPDKAFAAGLTALSALTGTPRRAATSSLVPCTVTAKDGTELESGTHFAAVTGDPSSRWTPVANFKAVGDGDHAGVMFRAERTGAAIAELNTIRVIATPVNGWTDIANTDEAAPGIDADDDPTLRVRRREELEQGSPSTIAGIRSALLAELPGVNDVLMLNNTTNRVDANGLPQKSWEAIVDGDSVGSDAIAQVLWDFGSMGIAASAPINAGGTSGTALDKAGNAHAVPFTRPVSRDVYISITIDPREGYVDDATFKSELVNKLGKARVPGVAVSQYDILLATGGLHVKVTDLTFGFAPSPASNAELTFTVRERPAFDTAKVTVTHA